MGQITAGGSRTLWNGALNTIAVGAITEELELAQSAVPSYVNISYSFDAAPTAVSIEIEVSENGHAPWRRVAIFTNVNLEGDSVDFPAVSGMFVRAKLVSKTGTTQVLTLIASYQTGIPGTQFADTIESVTANLARARIKSISEDLTLSTVGLTTDTAANLLPANSFILGVVARITAAITVTTNWALGDAGSAARYLAATTNLTIGTTKVGAAAGFYFQAAAAKLRVTCTVANPGAGRIRLTVFYLELVPPTS